MSMYIFSFSIFYVFVGPVVCHRVGLVLYFLCIIWSLFGCQLVSTSAIDCLERLVCEVTYYVLSVTLNLLTHSFSSLLPPHTLTDSVYVKL